MKTPEDEAFDELARKQGDWGGGYQAKKAMAADKLQEPEREALKLAEIIEHFDSNDESLPLELLKEIATTLRALAQPAQKPVVWWNGNSKFATPKAKDWDRRTGGITAFGCDIPLYTTPQHTATWVKLTDEEIKEIIGPYGDTPIKGYTRKLFDQIEAKLRSKNNG